MMKLMNKICLIGRITADPELKKTGEINYTRFTLAVNRKFTKKDGTRDADFISCVAWRKTAEIICNNLGKGSQIGIEGRLQTGSYDKEDGSKGYLTDVIVEEITFTEKKKEDRPAPEYTGPNEQDGQASEKDPFAEFGDSIEISDEDLPF